MMVFTAYHKMTVIFISKQRNEELNADATFNN